MTRVLAVATFSALLSAAAPAAAGGSALSVSDLRWDGRDRPLGLLQMEPRVSWVVQTNRRGQRQHAYQVLVASTPGKLRPGAADVWDSGRIASGESLNVRYGGPTPRARQRAYFTVRVWDGDDRASPFAAPSWWEMGLYDEEWEGQWIGRPRPPGEAAQAQAAQTNDRSVSYLRRTFTLPGDVRQARLYASAFGVYEASLNGRRAGGDRVLTPGYTDYEKRVLFQTCDVTALVHAGVNTLGAVVAGGWCSAGLGGRSGACGSEPPRVMMQLEATTADGKLHTIITDPTWRAHDGPLLATHLTDGERYDARRELPGWDTPAFAAQGWQPVQIYDREKERDLVTDGGPPIEVSEELAPVRTSPAGAATVFDFGQNVVGWARLAVRAAGGQTVTLRYAEALNRDGSLNTGSLGAGQAVDSYVARGNGTEQWEPRFTIHGFRYVEVSGLPPGSPRPQLVARVVHSRMAQTGTLETSEPLLDRLVRNIDWSQRGAFVSVPTTGPQRDQRVGGLLEAGAFAATACLLRDVQGFYRKWLDDVRDAQRPDASYTDTAPAIRPQPGGAGAAAAGVLVPHALYLCYADRTPLDAHLPSMGRWLEAVRAANPGGVWERPPAGTGDPLERGARTDPALIATALWAHAAQAVSDIARAGGDGLASYTRAYDAMAASVRRAFAARFLSGNGRLASDTQTAYALAIGLGVLAPQDRARAAPHLVAAVEREGRHVTAGVLGAAQLLPALSAIGRDDLAFALLAQPTCPSWLCSVASGATTIWERFDAWSDARGFAPGAPASLNYTGFGATAAWMFDAIGGIALDPAAPGGRHLLVRPRPGGGLTYARARYRSAYGLVATDWRLDERAFRLKVTVPANSTATVTLPIGGRVTEGGQPLARAAGVTVRRLDDAGAELALSSGVYDLRVTPR